MIIVRPASVATIASGENGLIVQCFWEFECIMSQLNVDTIGSQTSTSVSVASGHTLKDSSNKCFYYKFWFDIHSGADSTTSKFFKCR